MRTKFIPLLCALLILPSTFRAETEAEWTTDFDKGLRRAKEDTRPFLIDFSAIWCGPCQVMARATLQDADVKQKLASFVKMRADLDANPALAERFGIHAVPAFVVINSEGEELVRATGAMDAVAFGNWLNGALSTAALSASRKESFQKEKEAVLADLKGADAGTKAKAIDTLIDYSFRKENYYRDFAAANLPAAARDNPRQFLEFLNHQKLAVRILAANLLREQLGPKFAFDPWAATSARAPVIDKWKARLTLPR